MKRVRKRISGLACVAALAVGAVHARAAGCNAAPRTALHALGAGDIRRVPALRGVVTGVFPGLAGFFIEAPRDRWDADPATSEGVFVYTGRRHRSELSRGDDVVLAGRFQDYHGMPELTDVHVLARCGTAPLPPAVAVRLPLQRAGGWHGLLGMRVNFAAPLTVTDLHDFGRYGEVALAADGRIDAPTALTVPGPAAVALAQRDRARTLWLDDGSSHAGPWPLVLAGRRFDAEHPLREGQVFRSLTGIAYHAFGRDLLEPTGFGFAADANPRPAPGAPDLPDGLRIVTFNVQNYFNHALSGAPFPTERGARTPQAFACQTEKLVAAIAALHPAVAGLQEIENDGYTGDSAIAALTAALNAGGAGADYRYLRPAAPRLGTDLIAPALLYDARRLEPVGRTAVLAAPPGGALGAGLKRPALAASFRPRGGGEAFTVAVVHLRSKLTSCGSALDGFSGSGHCAGARTAAAAAVQRWLATDPTGAGTRMRFLVGDFNAYPKERAIAALERDGWRNLLESVRGFPASTYTESSRYGAGELDYVFANPAARARVAAAAVWHGDADEAPAFGYARHPQCAGPAAAFRASDHDPVLVVLRDGASEPAQGARH